MNWILSSYYESCTKETWDSGIKSSMYWCPSEEYVNSTTLEWIGDHSNASTFGYCTYPYTPKSYECPDHYHKVIIK